MKISFFDDEPELYPLQYGGKARTIINLANEFMKHPDVESVSVLSRSIFTDKDEFELNGVRYVKLDDSNTIEKIVSEANNTDILNIHCCSFTFPFLKCKAKKIYFMHDVLIATADKGSHLDKSLGGYFDYVMAPSLFAKSIYEKYRKIINGVVPCEVIPRHINTDLFFIPNDSCPIDFLNTIKKKYDEVFFFPSRPIAEKGRKYLIEFANSILNKNICIIGPFGDMSDLPLNCFDTGWIESENLKYYYSISSVTLNFSTLPESFSQVCIESVCCGCPVVAFAVGNVTDLGKITNAIKLCDRNLESIKKTVDEALILKRNNNQFSLEAKKLLDLFSKDVIIDQYINFYKKILKDGENYEK